MPMRSNFFQHTQNSEKHIAPEPRASIGLEREIEVDDRKQVVAIAVVDTKPQRIEEKNKFVPPRRSRLGHVRT
jgi:hypothetical protein